MDHNTSLINRDKNRSSVIAVEGRPFYYSLMALTLVVSVMKCAWWPLFLGSLTGFVMYFFRNPERVIPSGEGIVVCPADGKVIHNRLINEDKYLNAQTRQVSIFMNVFNVHMNRSPYQGKVVKTDYIPGEFINADFDKASELNERNNVVIETEKGARLLFVQIAGLIAKRIVSYVREGDTLERGERFGLIRFGSRVDIYLPPDTDIDVNVGDKVLAGETIIGRLK